MMDVAVRYGLLAHYVGCKLRLLVETISATVRYGRPTDLESLSEVPTWYHTYAVLGANRDTVYISGNGFSHDWPLPHAIRFFIDGVAG